MLAHRAPPTIDDSRMTAQLTEWLRQGRWTTLLDLALVAAIGVAAAHWTWVAFAPRALAPPSQVAPAMGAGTVGPVVRRGLFGPAKGAAAQAVSVTGLKLVGVIAEDPAAPGDAARAARAILLLSDGEAKAAAPGDALAPGLVLRAVHADHVIVARDGVLEKIALEREVADLHAVRAGAAQSPKPSGAK